MIALQRAVLNLSPLQAKARLRLDIYATKTVALTVAGILVFYTPTITFAILAKQDKHFGNVWFQFSAVFSPLVLSAFNPIIYALRTGGFISSFRNLFKNFSFQEETFKMMKTNKKREKITCTEEGEAKDIEKQDGGREMGKPKLSMSICSTDIRVIPVWRLRKDWNEGQVHSVFFESKRLATLSNDNKIQSKERRKRKFTKTIMLGQVVEGYLLISVSWLIEKGLLTTTKLAKAVRG